MQDKYMRQVALLVKCLPIIASEECFAIKGGTAINLFCLNLPRLSVDIDLVFLPIEDRDTTIRNIHSALQRITKNLEKQKLTVHSTGNPEKKLVCSDGFSEIKIEPNYTNRGFIYEPAMMEICPKAQDLFGYTEAKILSKAELWGGKICAALDRQHPRDLFDISNLFESDGITNGIKNGFLTALLNSPRPIHELLNPHFHLTEEIIEKEFRGMTDVPFSIENSRQVFDRLTKEIKVSLNNEDRKMLLDFVQLKADLSSCGIPNLNLLPGVKWKEQNLARLRQKDLKKFLMQADKLQNF